jgi:hypothetical protein
LNLNSFVVFFSFGAIRPVAYGESCIRKVGNESSFQWFVHAVPVPALVDR